jgi:hypothetical protein
MNIMRIVNRVVFSCTKKRLRLDSSFGALPICERKLTRQNNRVQFRLLPTGGTTGKERQKEKT